MNNLNNEKYVVSLYDYTGEALRPWAERGFQCLAFDIQHREDPTVESFESGGKIVYLNADLHTWSGFGRVEHLLNGLDIVFGMGFPVCTDLAVSGATHFKAKAKVDPAFQTRAVQHAKNAANFLDRLGCPWFIENPISVLATQWRKPDYRFDPFQYGGYIPADKGNHPTWPEYIAPFDAYPKRTCLWTGNGFVMPATKPVEVQKGYAKQHLKLGGKSAKTKNIRSATPRGFAIAICEANGGSM